MALDGHGDELWVLKACQASGGQRERPRGVRLPGRCLLREGSFSVLVPVGVKNKAEQHTVMVPFVTAPRGTRVPGGSH